MFLVSIYCCIKYIVECFFYLLVYLCCIACGDVVCIGIVLLVILCVVPQVTVV